MTATAISNISNDAAQQIEERGQYVAHVSIEGVCPILFHRWSCEAVEEKSKAKKGSKEKKTDNIESYVYRCADGTIGIPGTYLVGSMTDPSNGAAKYRQDPRSPRKSALSLYKAALQPLTDIASLGVTTWDFLDQRRVMVQRNGITRVRPAMLAGWRAQFDLICLSPDYIKPNMLLDCLVDAGRLVGIGDFRPTYGRFNITSFSID